MRAWFGTCIAVFAALAAFAPASANSASVTLKWYTQAVIRLSLVPNYAVNYGTVKAVFGSAQPTPSPGPGSCALGCAVDFGPVLSGTNYLYKYAAHLTVNSNDANGFLVYGEGAADFVNQADSSAQAINQTLYYLPSYGSAFGPPGSDANTGYSAALPFYKTSATVSGGGSFATAPSIAYGSYPASIANATAQTADLYYDYQLHVPPAATGGQYYVWIVYTVVAK